MSEIRLMLKEHVIFVSVLQNFLCSFYSFFFSILYFPNFKYSSQSLVIIFVEIALYVDKYFIEFIHSVCLPYILAALFIIT